MTNPEIAAMRARLETFDADRRKPRKPRRMSEPMAARTSSVGARIAEIKARPDDHPLGSLAQPLPMFDPLAESRAKAKATGDRLREVFRDV